MRPVRRPRPAGRHPRCRCPGGSRRGGRRAAPKRNKRHGERADGQRRPDLLAAEVGEEQRQELHAPLPRSGCFLLLRLHEDALVQMEEGGRPLGGPRVVRHHQDRLLCSRDEEAQQVQDLVRAATVEVAGGLVAEQEGRVGDDRPRDRDALLLPARELSREVLHAVARGPPAGRPLRRARAARGAKAVSGGGAARRSVRGEDGDQVVRLEHEADVARAPRR